MATLKPLGNNVIVKPLSENELSKSGIILPDTVDKDRPEKGEVISVGPGKVMDNGSRSEMNVRAGDKVVFKKYSPDEVKVDGEEYLVISETDILAIIEGDSQNEAPAGQGSFSQVSPSSSESTTSNDTPNPYSFN